MEEVGAVAEVDKVVLVIGEDVNSSAGNKLINPLALDTLTHPPSSNAQYSNKLLSPLVPLQCVIKIVNIIHTFSTTLVAVDQAGRVLHRMWWCIHSLLT